MSWQEETNRSMDGTADSPPLLSWTRLTQGAFIVLLALVVARSTLAEFARDPFQVLPGQAYTPLGPGAATSAVLNLLCWVPGLIVLVRRAGDGDYRLSRVVSPVLWVGLGGMALVSRVWASDRYLTVVAGSSWLGAGALCWGAAQLVRSWGRFRAVMATVAGILLVYCAHGFYYKFVEWPETLAIVNKTQDRILQERNFIPGSFQANQFLQKITRGEMTGFGASANTYAAMLVFGGIITAGLLVQGISRKRDSVLMFMLGVGLVGAVWCGVYAASKTAAVTPVVAAGLVACAAWASRRRWKARGAFFGAGLGSVSLVLLGVVAYGVHRGGLPGSSLDFRWRYWVGAWRMFLARPGLGVGWGSFGETYLQYRLPAASEEIKDPHNFLVRFATELGVVGLMGCVAWVASGTWESVRKSDVPGRRGLAIGAAGFSAAMVGGMLVNVICSIDFRAEEGYVIIELFKRCMYLGALIVGGSLALMSSKTSGRVDETASPWTLWAASAAVAVFFLHNLVDFSLFENGPMGMVAMVWGAVMGVRGGEGVGGGGTTYGDRGMRGGTRAAPLRFARGLSQRLAPERWRGVLAGMAAGAVAGWMVLFGWKGAAPLIVEQGFNQEGDNGLRQARSMADGPLDPQRVESAARAYEAAFHATRDNVDDALRAARAWEMLGSTSGQDRELLSAAHRANPLDVRPILQIARLDARSGDVNRAAEGLALVVALDPNDLDLRLELADLLERGGRLAEARDEILATLRANAGLDAAEPKRLDPARVAALRSKALAWAGLKR